MHGFNGAGEILHVEVEAILDPHCRLSSKLLLYFQISVGLKLLIDLLHIQVGVA